MSLHTRICVSVKQSVNKTKTLFRDSLQKMVQTDKITEPRHDKINKMTARPAKTQISLGFRPVWSESSLSAWRKLGSLATHCAHSEDSDQTGRMPRLVESSLGAHSFCLFYHVAAQLFLYTRTSAINNICGMYAGFPFQKVKIRLISFCVLEGCLSAIIIEKNIPIYYIIPLVCILPICHWLSHSPP